MRVVELSEVCQVSKTKVAPEDIQHGTSYVGLEHINPDGFYVSEFIKAGELKSPKNVFKPGQILFGKLRPYLRKTAVAVSTGICSTDVIVLDPKDVVSPQYLTYFLRQDSIVQLATERCSGANLPRISPKELMQFEMPLPPLEEQKRIAGILDEADRVRKKTQALIDKYDELAQSLFLDMFGDLRRHPKEAIKDVVKFIDYRGKSPNKVDSGIPLLTAKNVKVGYISEEPREYIPVDEYEEWMVRGFPKTGNVLFTTEAPLGQAALLPHYDKVAIAQRLICFQPNESLESNYLLHTILSPFFQGELNRRATGSTAKGIRSKELAKIEIPIPPLYVQNQFAERVQAIKVQKAQAQVSLAQEDDLFEALLQKAFKGELT